MRIHTTLDRQTMFDAAQVAGVQIEEFSRHGSRKRDHAYEVKLSGSSVYAAQGGAWKAATWDEWGNFLAYILDRDCTAICGIYNGRADFLHKTRAEVERIATYFRKGSRQREYHKGPWLRPLAGEDPRHFEFALGRA